MTANILLQVVAAPFLRALLAGNGTMLDLCTTDSLMENSVGAVFNGTAIVIDSMPYKEQVIREYLVYMFNIKTFVM